MTNRIGDTVWALITQLIDSECFTIFRISKTLNKLKSHECHRTYNNFIIISPYENF